MEMTVSEIFEETSDSEGEDKMDMTVSEIFEEKSDSEGEDKMEMMTVSEISTESEIFEEKSDSEGEDEREMMTESEIFKETSDSEGEEEFNYSSWDILENTVKKSPKNMQKCLQFCHLFPQDYEFQKSDLIQLWIAVEILSVPYDEMLQQWIAEELFSVPRHKTAYSQMVDRGSLYFEEFEQMHIFILSSPDHYKLNNSVFRLLQQHHDHAYSRVCCYDNTLHLSIYDSSIGADALQNLYHAKRLCTLLIFHGSGYKLDQAPQDIFLKLRWISVLDLSGTNIREVPWSVGELKHLRYLNLSGTPIAKLPEFVCRLYQMRILKLKGCLNIVLPKEMRRLIKLQYFDVDVARLLVSMPPGLGDLFGLHNLPAFVVGRENGCSITELKQMVNLHGTLQILRLENVSSSKEAADAALNSKKHIVKLHLQWSGFEDGIQFEVLQNLQPHTQIEELQIVGFASFEFPSWVGDPIFSKLVTITLRDCRKCKILPPLGKLPFLKHLFISDMHAVKAINSLFCGRYMGGGLLGFRRLVIKTTPQLMYNNVFLAFPSLENFTLNGMFALEKWIGSESGDFHHLQKLSITRCSKLTSLPDLSLLTSLQELEISHCTSLKSLSNKRLPISLQYLIIMECPLLAKWCLNEEKFEQGKLAAIPNIWIDDLHISLNTEVSDSGRNITTKQRIYKTKTRENKLIEGQLVNHGMNKKQLNMKERIFGKKMKGGNGDDGSFSFAELRKATRNFHTDSILGKDGFGTLFKGWIDEQDHTASKPGMGIAIAVKKLTYEGHQANSEWLATINSLGQCYHPNLVRLVGHCLKDEDRLLVYEFMPRGSLDKHLFRSGSYSQPLSWSLRMKVALGAAKGLAFLHSAQNNLIHRDFKTSNIFLDLDYNAKLSGFGLARDGPTSDESDVSSRIVGTIGYIDPEYYSTCRVSAKSDVYSFGVVLLELLSSRRANRPFEEEPHLNLVEWARPYLNQKRKICDILDNSLEGQYSLEGAWKVGQLALQCLSMEHELRPNMDKVVKALQKIQVSEHEHQKSNTNM